MNNVTLTLPTSVLEVSEKIRGVFNVPKGIGALDFRFDLVRSLGVYGESGARAATDARDVWVISSIPRGMEFKRLRRAWKRGHARSHAEEAWRNRAESRSTAAGRGTTAWELPERAFRDHDARLVGNWVQGTSRLPLEVFDDCRSIMRRLGDLGRILVLDFEIRLLAGRTGDAAESADVWIVRPGPRGMPRPDFVTLERHGRAARGDAWRMPSW